LRLLREESLGSTMARRRTLLIVPGQLQQVNAEGHDSSVKPASVAAARRSGILR
jgi:hypothetical protein